LRKFLKWIKKRNQTEKRSGKRKRDLTEEEKARRRERELVKKPLPKSTERHRNGRGCETDKKPRSAR